ncbi:hypothetical protein ACFL2R_03390 [Patescibacteria group bacterium]
MDVMIGELINSVIVGVFLAILFLIPSIFLRRKKSEGESCTLSVAFYFLGFLVVTLIAMYRYPDVGEMAGVDQVKVLINFGVSSVSYVMSQLIAYFVVFGYLLGGKGISDFEEKTE